MIEPGEGYRLLVKGDVIDRKASEFWDVLEFKWHPIATQPEWYGTYYMPHFAPMREPLKASPPAPLDCYVHGEAEDEAPGEVQGESKSPECRDCKDAQNTIGGNLCENHYAEACKEASFFRKKPSQGETQDARPRVLDRESFRLGYFAAVENGNNPPKHGWLSAWEKQLAAEDPSAPAGKLREELIEAYRAAAIKWWVSQDDRDIPEYNDKRNALLARIAPEEPKGAEKIPYTPPEKHNCMFGDYP